MIFKYGVNTDLEDSLVMFLKLAEKLGGEPFHITSAFRPDDDGAHGERCAVDISCRDSKARYKILKGLIGAGFRRIGIYDRHIHADRSLTRTDHVIWWGVSK